MLIEPLAGALAMALRKPVRLAYTRTEDMAGDEPRGGAPLRREGGHGGGREADGAPGAHPRRRGRVRRHVAGRADRPPDGGGYTWSTWDVEVTGVKTNKFGAGAYRGPTATQCAFAIEQLVDELAATLGLDPFDVRLRNAPTEGDPKLDGAWPAVGVRETLEAARAHPLWAKRDALPEDEAIGLAFGLFPGGRFSSGAVPHGARRVDRGDHGHRRHHRHRDRDRGDRSRSPRDRLRAGARERRRGVCRAADPGQRRQRDHLLGGEGGEGRRRGRA